jgi:tRNA (cmo5U34)-methyltransferase
VVSYFALHHVDKNKRVELYRSICEILKPNGFFINGDLFKSESPVINQWELDLTFQGIADRMRDQM